MAFNRSAGVLLHPTALSGGHGIGDLGVSARAFVDYLQRAGQHLWQILPLGALNDSGSPYQTLSVYAGNTLLISLGDLATEKLLRNDDLRDSPNKNEALVDFPAVTKFKRERLQTAWKNFNTNNKSKIYSREKFSQFQQEHKNWLGDFSLFMALREHYNEQAWWQWKDKNLIKRETAALKKWREKLLSVCEFHEWTQFIFYTQWFALKKIANDAGIKIIGDLPIYVGHDSVDVWCAPQFFAINAQTGIIETMSGAPPDYFSEDGQLWGNPVYRWDKLRDDNYTWWLNRMRSALQQTDILRLDHFRGFEKFWAVAAGEKTARNGQWEIGAGQDFFDALRQEFGKDLPLIAEDLGVITPEVDKLRDDNNFPGMKILQFAFCQGANMYRPHSYDKNCVVYTGTHDNDTTRGWYAANSVDYANMSREVINNERDLCRRYLAIDGHNIHWNLIRLAISSTANLAVYPLQDILGLDNHCRFNRPGIAHGNWAWRVTNEQMQHAEVNYLRDLCALYDR